VENVLIQCGQYDGETETVENVLIQCGQYDRETETVENVLIQCGQYDRERERLVQYEGERGTGIEFDQHTE
jgi:hypothetical protein